MGQRLRTHLDLLHPDTSRKVIEKQDKLVKVTKRCRKFAVGDRLYARNFRGNNKWIPVIVTRILGPVSYQVQTSSGSTQRRHVDQLRYCHSLCLYDIIIICHFLSVMYIISELCIVCQL